MKKLAIIATHPIQYNAPFFKLLAERKKILFKVFYTWSQSENQQKYDPGFGKNIKWDIPLLEGYDYLFVENIAKTPGSHHYNGINNPMLIHEIVSWGATAVMLYGWNFKSHLKAMKYFKHKLPVLFRGDSTLLDEKVGIIKIIRRLFLRYVYSNVDTALFAGKANKEYFKVHGFKDNEMEFMPHAVDNKRFELSEINSNEADKLKQLINIPKNATVFLFAGKLEEKKQPDFLANVFCQVTDDTTFLVIVGNGEMEKALKQKYFNHPQVRFLNFVNQQQMPSIYACCDVFILPSKGPGETWGLSINEAMAGGKAVIASDACGAAYDLVINERNGFVFEKNNSDMLKTFIQYFIGNKNAAKKMGEQSCQIIIEYSFEKECMALENVLMRKTNN